MKHIYTLEFWKDIKGYEGLYQVSNVGQVKSLIRNKLLKPEIRGGYLRVCLHKENKRKKIFIHRLVAEAFLSNEDELPEVDHINGDRTDNRVCNLQWITRVENNRKKQYDIIPRYVQCVETGEIFESITAAAKSVNRDPSTMGRHLKGLAQSCAGLHFKYYNGYGV